MRPRVASVSESTLRRSRSRRADRRRSRRMTAPARALSGVFRPPVIGESAAMTNWTRIWLSLSLAGVVAAGVAHHRLDADRKRQRPVAAECNRCVEAPGGGGKVLLRRLAAKAAVVRQLLDGRLTLLEAADWFKVLNETPGDC